MLIDVEIVVLSDIFMGDFFDVSSCDRNREVESGGDGRAVYHNKKVKMEKFRMKIGGGQREISGSCWDITLVHSEC